MANRQLGPPVQFHRVELFAVLVDLERRAKVDGRTVPVERGGRAGSELVHLGSLKDEADGALGDVGHLGSLDEKGEEGSGDDERGERADGKVGFDGFLSEGKGLAFVVGADDELYYQLAGRSLKGEQAAHQVETVKLLCLFLADALDVLEQTDIARDGFDVDGRLARLSLDTLDGAGRVIVLVIDHDDSSSELGKVTDGLVALVVSRCILETAWQYHADDLW